MYIYIYNIIKYSPKVVGEEVNIPCTTSPVLVPVVADAGSERCHRAAVAQQRGASGASATRRCGTVLLRVFSGYFLGHKQTMGPIIG